MRVPDLGRDKDEDPSLRLQFVHVKYLLIPNYVLDEGLKGQVGERLEEKPRMDPQ